VVALYVNGVVCARALKHTLVAVAAVVIVGNAFTVTVKVVPLLTHPLALVTVIVPV
jgi:hypothetical protein